MRQNSKVRGFFFFCMLEYEKKTCRILCANGANGANSANGRSGHHKMYGGLGLYMFIGIEDANKIMVWDVLQVMVFLGMVSA